MKFWKFLSKSLVKFFFLILVELTILNKEKEDQEVVLTELQKKEKELKEELEKKRRDAENLQLAIKKLIADEIKRKAEEAAKEAAAILQRVEDGVTKPRPKILFEPGEVVRVKEGPFVDFNGVAFDAVDF